MICVAFFIKKSSDSPLGLEYLLLGVQIDPEALVSQHYPKTQFKSIINDVKTQRN